MPPKIERSEPLRVMVTGATGFVGLHTVVALCEAGHDARLLVRSREKAERALEPFGLSKLPTVVGDMTDPAAVREALDGCNAAVHAAALVSVRAADAELVLRTNLAGTRTVLDAAVELGIDRIVQVSSVTALHRESGAVVDEQTPLATDLVGYGRSKVECDRHARRLQAEGAGIHTSYPGSVIGPYDPGMSEAMSGLRNFLDTRVLPTTTTGMQLIDVRDLARAHVLMLERGGPPDRFVLGGRYLTWAELADALEEVTGARFLRLPAPRPVMQAVGAIGDLIGHFVRIELPISSEAMLYATDWTRSDDERVRTTLGLEYRASNETLRDTIRWLASSGHLWRRYRV